jgi:uncharacterized protein involved in exopolysaccharide biosynthesis
MELRRYFAIIAAYRWHLVIPTIVAALIALAATYAISARYVATAVVQIIPDDTEPRAVTLRPQDGPGVVATGFRDPTELLAQGVIETLGSRAVAQHVAETLELSKAAEPQGWDAFKSGVRGVFDDAWAVLRYGFVAHKDRDAAITDVVERSVSAELVRGSYYMRISGSWRDPETAAQMANTAVQSILLHTREVASASAAEQRQFLDNQVDAARLRVNTAREAVLAYSRENVITGETIRLAVNALEEARASLRQSDLELADARSRLNATQLQLAATPKESTAQQFTQGVITGASDATVSSSAPNPVYLGLQTDIANLEQQSAALAAGHGLNTSDLQARNDAALADVRARLTTIQNQISEKGISDIVYDSLKDQGFALQRELAALEARQAQELSALNAQHEASLADARSRLEIARRQLQETNPALTSVQTIDGSPTGNSVEQRTIGPNTLYLELQSRVNTLEQEVSGLEASHVRLQAAVTDRSQNLRDLTAKDGQLAALDQELTLASDEYGRRTSQLYEAMLEEARPIAQIRLIDPAVAPLYPASPLKILWVAIGALAGLLAGMFYTFIHYNADISLRSGREAARALRLPMLAEIPVLPAMPSGRVIVLPTSVQRKDES